MVVDQKEAETKAFFQKITVRTMKKDLKQLRETDAMQERQKISTLQGSKSTEKSPIDMFDAVSVKNEPVKRMVIKVTAPEIKEATENVLQDTIKNEPVKPVITSLPETDNTKLNENLDKIKDWAIEAEKQQIFLLQSQKESLQNQLKDAKKPADSSQKDDILKQQKEVEEKLNALVQKEQTAPEDQKQTIEKQRWVAEGELAKLEEKMKNLEANNQQSSDQENATKTGIKKIEEDLKNLYSLIAKRGGATEEIKQEGDEPDVDKNPEPIKAVQPDFLKEIPLVAKEKLAASTITEEKQRRRFMEDVERWAASNTKSE